MKKYKGFVCKEAYLEYLLKERKALIRIGSAYAIYEINEVIARLARKLKIDYYSLN